MRCLVTGAAGFIGFHLANALLARGAAVWGLDDLSKGRQQRLELLAKNPGFGYTVASLAEEKVLRRLVAETDVIYHLAAVVGVKRYVEDPVKVVEVNVCQTARLLETAWELGKRVVFASTSEVYGKGKTLPYSESADRNYGPSYVDRWCYGVAKGAAEHLCLGYAKRGLPVVILRYFNVYGPHADSSEYGGVVARFIAQALAGRPLTVHGDGSQTRCFTYVDDIVAGTIAAAGCPEAAGGIFNLGNRRETSIRELAQLILDLSGSQAGMVFIPHEEFYGPHYEDIPRRVPDLRAAEQILGYRPQVSLEDGLRRTLTWYKEQVHKE